MLFGAVSNSTLVTVSTLDFGKIPRWDPFILLIYFRIFILEWPFIIVQLNLNSQCSLQPGGFFLEILLLYPKQIG